MVMFLIMIACLAVFGLGLLAYALYLTNKNFKK